MQLEKYSEFQLSQQVEESDLKNLIKIRLTNWSHYLSLNKLFEINPKTNDTNFLF